MKILKGGKDLIAADTNARSKTWHDHFTNSRGKKVEEFIAASNLHIINEHSTSNTFCNTRGISNSDLTTVSANLLKRVLDWEISEEESQADHNCIKFNIGTEKRYSNTNTNLETQTFISEKIN